MSAFAWHDDPKTSPKDDAFDREDYAKRTARLIVDSHSRESSTVFGLVGPWGSGKSTLINFMRLTVEESSLVAEGGPEWKVVSFTPWATSDPSTMLGEFFAALSSAFPEETSDKLRKRLGRLAAISTPATSMIPVVGAGVTKAAELLAEHLGSQRPWQVQFDAASKLLREQDTPVLIVVDDVDRLQGEELLTLLKVIRLLGRFPGIQYLLAYDDVTLFRTLNREIAASGVVGTGQEFMEKIVQFPVPVPALTEVQMLRRLNEGIDRAAEATGRTIAPSARVNQLLDTFRSALDTPRAIDRYSAQLHHQFAMLHQDEVDDEDLLVLTLIRCAYPTVYALLPSWRKRLLSGNSTVLRRMRGESKDEPVDLTPLLEGLPQADHEHVEAALHTLFPRLKRPSYGDLDRTSRRVSIESYFNRYFSLTITTDDVSDRLVTDAVTEAAGGDPNRLTELLTDERPERAFLAADKAARLDLSALSWDRRARAVRLILALVNDVSNAPVGLFSSPRDRVRNWVGRLLAEAGPEAKHEVRALLDETYDLPMRLQVWVDVRRALGVHAESGLPSWVDEYNAELGNLAREAFLSNVSARDGASLTDGYGWCRSFAARYGDSDTLHEAIRTGLASDAFNLEDIIARTVSTRHLLGVKNPQRELSEPDIEELRLLGLPTEDPWFDLPIEPDVEIYDLSWANRRRYARGRISRTDLAPED